MLLCFLPNTSQCHTFHAGCAICFRAVDVVVLRRSSQQRVGSESWQRELAAAARGIRGVCSEKAAVCPRTRMPRFGRVLEHVALESQKICDPGSALYRTLG